VIFNGKNYELWQKAIRTVLKSKNKLGFIEGTLTKPTPKGEDFSELNAWEMVNSMICSWIINVIDPKLHTSVAYAETAYEMWENLRKRYAIANTLRSINSRLTLQLVNKVALRSWIFIQN